MSIQLPPPKSKKEEFREVLAKATLTLPPSSPNPSRKRSFCEDSDDVSLGQHHPSKMPKEGDPPSLLDIMNKLEENQRETNGNFKQLADFFGFCKFLLIKILMRFELLKKLEETK
jgi:hypothetical protein